MSTEAVETIVAADPLIDLGCRLDWSKKGCSLIHPTRGVIPLSLSSGCPRMPEKLGLELIAEIEGSRLVKVAHGVRALRLKAQCAEWTLEQILDQVVRSIRQNLDVSAWLRVSVDRLWPSLPEEVVQELVSWPLDNPAASPWNRRKRRTIDKASQVFIHLFAGASAKPFEHVAESCGTVPLSVDKQQDLSAPQTYRYLLSVGASGKVAACIGGPPCNTHTLCRFAPNGPPPVRGRGENWEWGLPGITEAQLAQVHETDVLRFRSFLVMIVSRHARKRLGWVPTWSLVENPQDPVEYLPESCDLGGVCGRSLLGRPRLRRWSFSFTVVTKAHLVMSSVSQLRGLVTGHCRNYVSGALVV